MKTKKTIAVELELAYTKLKNHNAIFIIVNSIIEKSYYITYVKQSKMFTLWCESIMIDGKNTLSTEEYVRDLSTNLNKAVDRALLIIGPYSSVYIKIDDSLKS